MKTKTGKKRYRINSRLFGNNLLVLQFEYKETNRYRMVNCNSHIDVDDLPDVTYWEDAKPEDLLEEED